MHFKADPRAVRWSDVSEADRRSFVTRMGEVIANYGEDEMEYVLHAFARMEESERRYW